MKRKHLILTCLLFSCIAACKKELLSSAETPTATMLSNAKSFYSQQLTSLPKVSSTNQGGLIGSTDDRKIKEEKAPIWDEAKMEKTVDGRTVMTVPLKKHNLDNKDVEYVRKYVFEERNGNIADGKIIEVIGTPELIEEKGESTVTRYKDKQIAGFSGAVISYDLNYRYLEGHQYQNGRQVPGSARIIPKLPNTTGKGSGRGKLASANIPNKISTEIGDDGPTQTCTNWYLVTYYYDQYGDFMYSKDTYLGATCTGGGYVGPPPLGGGSTEIVKYDCAGEPNGTASRNNPCNICMGGNTGITECPKEIKTDSLKKRFPCAKTLIVDSLGKIERYRKLVEPFLQKGVNPSITWDANTQPWTNATYSAGTTGRSSSSGLGMSSDIYLNSVMLQNSSKLLIAATAIHETYHAYINYMFANNISVTLFDKSQPNFMAGLYQYIIYEKSGSGNNYVDHYNMLTSQFDNMVDILFTFANGSYTKDDCRKAMLFGMNNSGPNPDFGQTQFINQAYTDLLARFGFTVSNIESFHLAQINAPNNKKLPTSGCNN